jgi:hypothetical protein
LKQGCFVCPRFFYKLLKPFKISVFWQSSALY